jgi:DNA invertase Pin-like site-specific DNA recombinase
VKAAIHTRVSTTDQNAELAGSGAKRVRRINHGWEIVDTYADVMIGAKASRRGLNRLMADAMARKFDCLLVWKTGPVRALPEAEFERSLIRERTQAGRLRYTQDYAAGKVGKTVSSRSVGIYHPTGRRRCLTARR